MLLSAACESEEETSFRMADYIIGSSSRPSGSTIRTRSDFRPARGMPAQNRGCKLDPHFPVTYIQLKTFVVWGLGPVCMNRSTPSIDDQKSLQSL